jgi:hypothetical protein
MGYTSKKVVAGLNFLMGSMLRSEPGDNTRRKGYRGMAVAAG